MSAYFSAAAACHAGWFFIVYWASYIWFLLTFEKAAQAEYWCIQKTIATEEAMVFYNFLSPITFLDNNER